MRTPHPFIYIRNEPLPPPTIEGMMPVLDERDAIMRRYFIGEQDMGAYCIAHKDCPHSLQVDRDYEVHRAGENVVCFPRNARPTPDELWRELEINAYQEVEMPDGSEWRVPIIQTVDHEFGLPVLPDGNSEFGVMGYPGHNYAYESAAIFIREFLLEDTLKTHTVLTCAICMLNAAYRVNTPELVALGFLNQNSALAVCLAATDAIRRQKRYLRDYAEHINSIGKQSLNAVRN